MKLRKSLLKSGLAALSALSMSCAVYGATPVPPVTTSTNLTPIINTKMYEAYTKELNTHKKSKGFDVFLGATTADISGDQVDELIAFSFDEARGSTSMFFCSYDQNKLTKRGGTSFSSLGHYGNDMFYLVSDETETDFAIKHISISKKDPGQQNETYYKLTPMGISSYLQKGLISSSKGLYHMNGKPITQEAYQNASSTYTKHTPLLFASSGFVAPTDYTQGGKKIYDLAQGITIDPNTPYTLIGRGKVDTIPVSSMEPISKAKALLGTTKTMSFQGVTSHTYKDFSVLESLYSPYITGFLLPKGFTLYGVTIGDSAQVVAEKIGLNYTKAPLDTEFTDELAPANTAYSYSYTNGIHTLRIYFDKNHNSLKGTFISKIY